MFEERKDLIIICHHKVNLSDNAFITSETCFDKRKT